MQGYIPIRTSHTGIPQNAKAILSYGQARKKAILPFHPTMKQPLYTAVSDVLGLNVEVMATFISLLVPAGIPIPLYHAIAGLATR